MARSDVDDLRDATVDAVLDGRRAALAMRRAVPPATYGEIAASLGVARSTAYRWANPEAFEYDRMRSRKVGGRLALRDAERFDALRSRRGRPTCRRCGAERARGSAECWRCRLVDAQADVARTVLRLIDAGVAATPAELRAADPALGDADLPLLLRQLASLGGIEAPDVRTDALADRAVVHDLAGGRPAAIGDLSPEARRAAVAAAGCLVALRSSA